MRQSLNMLILTILLMGSLSSYAQAQDDVPDRPMLMAHYMPWYQTPDVSGYWGWHWTMDHFEPTQQDANGNPEIASHSMPLTGPYDSQDHALLEYQVLLMKLSGIDGVIVDWYGTENFQDYAVLNAATGKLFDYVKRAGLRFIICYEDRTVQAMVNSGYTTRGDDVSHGQLAIQYLHDNWFSDDAYVKFDGQPLLFVFGPQYFKLPEQWEAIFAGLDPAPALITEDNRLSTGALTNFPWPPMQMSGGIELPQVSLDTYLRRFYRNAHHKPLIVGSAFPGFHDIYEEAGVRLSYGSIDAHDGETFRATLDTAITNNADIVQLVTWNDYGEGTTIEPTEEYGYRYLEIVQDTRRVTDDDFTFTAEDLRLPIRLYELRKANTGNDDANAQLDDAFNAIVAGDPATAATILAAFPSTPDP